MDKSTNKDVRENIISILDCLLKNEERKCNTCRNCEDVDVCCFLTDAVIVCKHKSSNKSDSVL
jgi:hypothetical protein